MPHTAEAFAGQSEMHQRVREHDWSRTSIGPIDRWPEGLRSTIKTLLGSRYPMILLWGDELLQFYNDAYIGLIGNKHPGALGRSIRVTQAESWPVIGPMIQQVMSTGVPNWVPAQQLPLERSGYREESYFSLSYSAVEGDDGAIRGMLCVCSEVTQQVLSERRTRLLRDLSMRAGETRSVEKTSHDVMAALREHPLDLPFAALWSRGADGSLTLRDSAGASNEVLERIAEGLGLREARGGRPRAIALDPLKVTLHEGTWGDRLSTAVLMPIQESVSEAPLAFLLAGLSPNRALDEPCTSFYALLQDQVTIALRNARAYQEERGRAEELTELDRAKTAFFSNVSHEFRTPLTLILGPLSDVLARPDKEVSPTVRREIEVAHRNAGRLLRLVNTLLDFSRIEAGRAQASYEPVDLAHLTAELSSSFRSAMERANLTLEVDAAPLSQPVHVDRDLWEKIVLNLLSNAFKFTFEGRVTVRVREEQGEAVVEVEDTGTGIPASELPRLFERFYRVKGARSRSFEGTGIGLALVEELVKLHGGRIGARSLEGKGTTFEIRIPFGTSHLPADRVGSAPEASTAISRSAYVDEALRWLPDAAPVAGGALAPGGARPRILLADDNADMRDYVRGVLAAEFEVEAVADGQAALERALAQPPDVVLSDVMMPRLDGVGLLRALRASPHTKDIPIILLSARVGEEAKLEGLASGADEYLFKPFSAREVQARVRALLALVRTRRQAVEERARGEHLLEALRTRDEFLSVASHELKTPLAALQLQLAALARELEGDVPRPVTERLTRLEGSLHRLSRLVDTLMDVSQLNSGRLKLVRESIDVSALLTEVASAWEEDARRVGTDLTVMVQSPIVGEADAVRLAQVLQNLLSNALKFGRGRPVELRLHEEGDAVVLSVIDHGTGVRPEDKLRIFDRFERAVSTRHFGGLGLGLWVTRQLVQAHGGRVEVDDTPGGGATFRVRLPRSSADLTH